MTEFEKAKERYEKKAAKKAKVVPIKKKQPDEVRVFIRDDEREYEFGFLPANIKGQRLGARRNEQAYRDAVEAFMKKEFGKWQLSPTR